MPASDRAFTGHQKNATITGHWMNIGSQAVFLFLVLATKENPFELLLHQIQRHFWGEKNTQIGHFMSNFFLNLPYLDGRF
jgi:hypothetical protein